MPRYEAFDWYGDDVRYYDLIFDEDTPQQVAFLDDVMARYGDGGPGRRVLEPACGSGRLVAAMASRGWEVAGFDLSDPSLEYARRRVREAGCDAELFNARLESFRVSSAFDLAHCLVSTFKYVDSEAGARQHLESVARALRPGGLYVLGVHLTDYSDRGCSRERWTARAPGLEVVCNIQGWPADRRRRTEQVRSRLHVKEQGCERHLETSWTFRTYGPRQLLALLRSVPAFEHVATHTFDHAIDRTTTVVGDRLDLSLVLRRR